MGGDETTLKKDKGNATKGKVNQTRKNTIRKVALQWNVLSYDEFETTVGTFKERDARA